MGSRTGQGLRRDEGETGSVLAEGFGDPALGQFVLADHALGVDPLGYIRRTIKPSIGSTQVRKVRGGGSTTLRHYADPVPDVDRRAAAYLAQLTAGPATQSG